MDDGQILGIIQRLEWRERWMKAKEPIKIDGAILAAAPRFRYCDLRSVAIVIFVTKRNDHRYSIHCSALENGDKYWRVRAPSPARFTKRRPPQKRWSRRQAHHCQPR